MQVFRKLLICLRHLITIIKLGKRFRKISDLPTPAVVLAFAYVAFSDFLKSAYDGSTVTRTDLTRRHPPTHPDGSTS